jgi:acyl carrier protein
MSPAPVGVAGELYVGGDGLARGYLGRPALTAERFVPDPFSSEPGGRLYRTGDLVRYTASGELHYLGRLDHQVKIRGFRIELGEIEAVLSSHDGVRECVVIAREDAPGEKRLVAYIVGAAGDAEGVARLRAYAAERLPAYMVPSAFVVLEELPLTPNGKVDRKALPAPEGRPEGAADYVEPRNETERALARIWAGVLGVERVGAEDNFFDLGGHSLLATQVILEVRREFGVEIPLRHVFETPTVAYFATLVERGRAAGQDAPAAEIQARPRKARSAAELVAKLDRLSPEEVQELLREKRARARKLQNV